MDTPQTETPRDYAIRLVSDHYTEGEIMEALEATYTDCDAQSLCMEAFALKRHGRPEADPVVSALEDLLRGGD